LEWECKQQTLTFLPPLSDEVEPSIKDGLAYFSSPAGAEEQPKTVYRNEQHQEKE
jgi:hypothetical protein